MRSWRRSPGWCCARATSAAYAPSTESRSGSTWTARRSRPSWSSTPPADRAPSPAISGQRAGFGGSCGIAYVDRQYQLHPGAEPGPLINPIAWQGDFDGYQVIVFPHERGIFSVLIVRPSDDHELKLLRHDAAFDAACAAIPALAAWTDPQRAAPLASVLPGGELLNHYRGQYDAAGRPLLDGLVAVGDSVGTTTPIFGRGVALLMTQARALLAALDQHRTDLRSAVAQFDALVRRRDRALGPRPHLHGHGHGRAMAWGVRRSRPAASVRPGPRGAGRRTPRSPRASSPTSR